MEAINIFIDRLLGLPFTVGLIFLITGAILYVFPPKKINSLYGYRTPRSMKSQESWAFAQTFSALKTIQCGLFLILVSGVSLIFKMSSESKIIISFVLLIAVVAALFLITESKLKSKFPKSE